MLKIVPLEQIPKLEDIEDIPIDNPEDLLNVYKICLQLEELCEASKGIGIAAVQAGIPWKLFLVKSDGHNIFVPRNKYGYFVNCTYEPTTNAQRIVSLEGCLSLRSPDGRLRQFQVERYSEIALRGHRLILENRLFLEKLDIVIGLRDQGIVFQHEAEHQQGILISDIGREITLWRTGI